jgi:hypothetical protein
MTEKKTTALEQKLVQAVKEQSAHRDIKDMGEHLTKLRSLSARFLTEYTFRKGDFVVWKEELKNKIRPAYNEPCVVIDILSTPIYDKEKSAGTTYLNEPLDLVLGVLDSDGDFIVFHYDKRRFQPYEQQ